MFAALINLRVVDTRQCSCWAALDRCLLTNMCHQEHIDKSGGDDDDEEEEVDEAGEDDNEDFDEDDVDDEDDE